MTQQYARVHDGVVVEVDSDANHQGIPGWIPSMSYSGESYEAAFPGTWVPCPPGAGVGHSHDGKSFAAPVVSLLQAQAAAAIAATSHHKGVLSAGFSSGGVLFSLDPISQVRIMMAGMAAIGSSMPKSGLTWPSNFRYPDASNGLHTIPAPQMMTVFNQVAHYVVACDACLAGILSSIWEAKTAEEVVAIDVRAGYPAAVGS